MGAKEVGFAKESEDGKEGLGRANFVLEELEGVRQGVADGPAEGPEAKGVEKSFSLIANASGAVLEILVVEA